MVGDGIDVNDYSLFQKISKRKLTTVKTVIPIIDIAMEKGDAKMVKSLWNAYHCQDILTVSDGRVYAKYCKNRYCTECCAIRKAEMINKYYPTLAQWNDAYLVTLTIKSCKESELRSLVNDMCRGFKQMIERCKKRHQRGRGIKLQGIKSLECNFNPVDRTYNPHFHLIVPSREVAVMLVVEWQKQWKVKGDSRPYKRVSPMGQHIRKVKNVERDLIEVIKYSTKIFTDPDMKKKNGRTLPPKIYVYALYNIYTALKNKRIFERFGFNLPVQSRKSSSPQLVDDCETLQYDLSAGDWVNQDTGECFTGYRCSAELNYLLNDSIDNELR